MVRGEQVLVELHLHMFYNYAIRHETSANIEQII